jgi:hypothetical protein
VGIGHLGLAFASKRLAPRASLGLLLLAGLFADALMLVTLPLGLEHVRIVPGITATMPFDLYDYPISHSLVALMGWGLLTGGAYHAFARDRFGAIAIAVGVVSHWPLDVISHRADVPLLFDGPYLGLGLWNSLPGSLLVEAAILLAGAFVYFRSTRAIDRWGRFGALGLVAFMLVSHAAGYLGPSAESVDQLMVGMLLVGLPLLAAHFVDRHRAPHLRA